MQLLLELAAQGPRVLAAPGTSLCHARPVYSTPLPCKLPLRLQDYYHAMGGIEEMRAQIQFPKLEPPPTDFLHQMEEYCKEAPRPINPNTPVSPGQPQGAKKVRLLASMLVCSGVRLPSHRLLGWTRAPGGGALQGCAPAHQSRHTRLLRPAQDAKNVCT